MAQLGVQMYSLREYTQNETDLAAALQRVFDIGYRSIQVSAFGEIPAAVTAELCDKIGLTIGGTHISWERLQHDLDTVIDEHRVWNCKHAAVGFIPPKEYLSMDGLSKFVQEQASVTAGLMEAGLTFSYHNHGHEFVHFAGRPWLAHLLEQTDALAFELDTHWIVAGGADPVEWIHRVAQRAPLLHLKDFHITPDYKRRFAAVGDGNLNWPAILDAAGQYPIDFYFVEQDDCYGEDEFACLERSFRYLTEYGLS